MKIATAESVAGQDANPDGRSTRTGTYVAQRLFTEDEPDGLNFVFLRNDFVFGGAEAFRTPRHRHTFAQIRFIEKGAANYAPDQYIHEGEIGYFPRMAYYGPQVKEDCVSIVVQYGFNGEHQKGPVWEGLRKEALESLKKRGKIVDGTYVDTHPETGEERVRDGVEAVYEEQYRMRYDRQLVTRSASYEAPVIMHPSAFEWFKEAPGLEMRRLGVFFDQPGPNGDTRVSMARLSGGELVLSGDRAQLVWTLMPGLVVDGSQQPEKTFIYTQRDEAVTLNGQDGIEVYIIEFPKLD